MKVDASQKHEVLLKIEVHPSLLYQFQSKAAGLIYTLRSSSDPLYQHSGGCILSLTRLFEGWKS